MSKLLNITGSKVVDDPSFRYKMPSLVCRIEGRGNGIRTCIVNLSDIATALNRPPDILTKYFGVELGAQSRYENDADKSTVNGAHTQPDLQRLIGTFCDRFVLCPKCSLPETALAVSLKRGIISHKCSACGAKEPVDLSHKLCTYIMKQAELAAAAAAAAEPKPAKGEKKEKREKKEKKSKKSREGEAEAGGGGGGGGEEERSEEEAEEAKEAEEEEEEKAAAKAPSAAAPAPAAAAAAAAAAPAGAAAQPSALAAALCALLSAPKDAGARAAAARAAAGVKAQAATMAEFQRAAASAPERLRAVPIALEALYDEDVFSEEFLLAWAAGAEGDEQVKAKAKPFIEWLQNAESEEED